MPGNLTQDRTASQSEMSAVKRQALLNECIGLFKPKLVDLVRMSIGHTNDLFEFTPIPDKEVSEFLRKRGECLENFNQVYGALYARRLRGERRKGRRPDSDAAYDPDRAVDELEVLSAEDYRTQTMLIKASRMLQHVTKRETLALDLRMEILLANEPDAELDNPFGLPYVLDAVGFTSRAVYPSPNLWRPLMHRVVGDLTWSIKNVYIALNRLLADRGVLPEIMAVLRARSQHRPKDDKELLGKFSQLMEAAGLTAANDVVVAAAPQEQTARPSVVFAEAPVTQRAAEATEPQLADQARMMANPMSTPTILAGLAALAKSDTNSGSAPLGAADEFPELVPLLALGSSAELLTSLGNLQKHNLATAVHTAIAEQGGTEDTEVPLNLIPYIRAANSERIANPTDRIMMDVIGLLFDYIFRDGSIPQSLRVLFSRLQVPIMKAALLDRVFFSDQRHPARAVLDHLAEGAVGADPTHDYGRDFKALATEVVEGICRDFQTDIKIFIDADRRIVEFMATEKTHLNEVLAQHIAQAEMAEAAETDRAEVRVIIRERLAGLNVPFTVHSFVETWWAAYLLVLRRQFGADSVNYRDALETVDKLLWSIVAKERNTQRMRLATLIPGLIGSLRRGIAAVDVPKDEVDRFLSELYDLHVAAIKPQPVIPDAVIAAGESVSLHVINVHDFVSDMGLGTWITFSVDGESLTTQLAWFSPTRSRFIFVRHTPARVLSFDAESLAYELGTGRATLVLETVPLFDRAVSTALDQLAAKAPTPDSTLAKLTSAFASGTARH